MSSEGGNVVCHGSPRLGLHTESSLLHCAATLADAPYVTYVQQFFVWFFFFHPGQTKCWKILYLSWCQDFKKVSLYFWLLCVFLYFQPVEETLSLSSTACLFLSNSSTCSPHEWLILHVVFYKHSLSKTLYFLNKALLFSLIIPVPIVVTNFPFGKFWNRCIMSKLFANTMRLFSSRLPFGSVNSHHLSLILRFWLNVRSITNEVSFVGVLLFASSPS